MRIPTKPATHSNRKPATDSDLKPAGVPIEVGHRGSASADRSDDVLLGWIGQAGMDLGLRKMKKVRRVRVGSCGGGQRRAERAFRCAVA